MGDKNCGTELYLDEKFARFDDKLRAINDKIKTSLELRAEDRTKNEEEHQEIIKQTTKTNGSVAKANCEIAELKIWKGYVTGAVAVIMAVIVPLFFLLVRNYLEK